MPVAVISVGSVATLVLVGTVYVANTMSQPERCYGCKEEAAAAGGGGLACSNASTEVVKVRAVVSLLPVASWLLLAVLSGLALYYPEISPEGWSGMVAVTVLTSLLTAASLLLFPLVFQRWVKRPFCCLCQQKFKLNQIVPMDMEARRFCCHCLTKFKARSRGAVAHEPPRSVCQMQQAVSDAAGCFTIGIQSLWNTLTKFKARLLKLLRRLFAFFSDAAGFFTSGIQSLWNTLTKCMAKFLKPPRGEFAYDSDAAGCFTIGTHSGVDPDLSTFEQGVPQVSFRASGLPAGLSINSSTGVIEGTPVGPVTVCEVTVTAFNDVGEISTTVRMRVMAEREPTEEGTAAPDAQDAIEESVEASDAMADAVPAANEDAGARVAESAPVEHESACLPDAQDDIAESTAVAEPLEPLAEGVVAVEEQEKDTAIEGSQVLAEEGTPGFGDGQDAEPLEEAVADVVEQEAVQGASETVEEAAAAVFNDEAGISEPEQEALPRDIEEAAVQEEAPAEVLWESPDKLQLTRLLKQYGLEDEGDVLASNGIKKVRDLSFIDEPVADEEAGASVAESTPVVHESAGLPDAQDDIARSTVVISSHSKDWKPMAVQETLQEQIAEKVKALVDKWDQTSQQATPSKSPAWVEAGDKAEQSVQPKNWNSMDVELQAKEEEERAGTQLKVFFPGGGAGGNAGGNAKKKPKPKAKPRTIRQPLAPLEEEEEEVPELNRGRMWRWLRC
jgi:hypothetical protein